MKQIGLVVLIAAACASGPAAAQTNTFQQILQQVLGGGSGDGARCESISGRTQVCNVPAGYRAEFVRQTSSTACTAGRNMLIEANRVTVSGGCRAEFRLVPVQGAAAVNQAQLERTLLEAMRTAVRKPDGEYGSLYDVKVINASSSSPASAREQVITGLGQAVWGGRTYPLEYTARLDTASGRLLNFDYRYQNPNANGSSTTGDNWQTGSALDNEARDALARAIEAEYRRRSGVRTVQVAINTAYREQMVTRSDYRFEGKYGVSINDGNWETYGYSGRVFLPRNTVSELQYGTRP